MYNVKYEKYLPTYPHVHSIYIDCTQILIKNCGMTRDIYTDTMNLPIKLYGFFFSSISVQF